GHVSGEPRRQERVRHEVHDERERFQQQQPGRLRRHRAASLPGHRLAAVVLTAGETSERNEVHMKIERTSYRRARLAGIGAAAAALLLGTVSASAHHAFSAEFDIDQPVELKGVVTRLEWTNPHSWLFVDVTNADGSVTPWAVEFGAPHALMRRRGLRKTDFPVGVEVVVKGYRAKSGKPVANASTVTFPDGRDFYTADDDA